MKTWGSIKPFDDLYYLTPYVAGLFDGEGCHHKISNGNGKSLSFYNSDKDMLNIVEHVLQQNGIDDYSIGIQKSKGHIDYRGITSNKDQYQIFINKDGQKRFWETIGPYCTRLKRMFPTNMDTDDFVRIDTWLKDNMWDI